MRKDNKFNVIAKIKKQSKLIIEAINIIMLPIFTLQRQSKLPIKANRNDIKLSNGRKTLIASKAPSENAATKVKIIQNK